MVGVSLNKIREGQPGFLTNLWITPDKYLDDPYLSNEATRINVPNHVKTILLLGSDYQPEIGFRTDVMLLMAFNTKTNKVNLISFPRDLWVTIPGLGEQRLNVAFPFGDWQLLSDTFALNFGFRPDHYMMADFEGFSISWMCSAPLMLKLANAWKTQAILIPAVGALWNPAR